MDIQTSIAALPPLQHAVPPPAEPDGRAVADTVAIRKDPTPEVPLPIPASPNQSGLISKAALPEKESAPKLDMSGVSSEARTLKPYGINMLPEKTDAPKQVTPTDPAGE